MKFRYSNVVAITLYDGNGNEISVKDATTPITFQIAASSPAAQGQSEFHSNMTM